MDFSKQEAQELIALAREARALSEAHRRDLSDREYELERRQILLNADPAQLRLRWRQVLELQESARRITETRLRREHPGLDDSALQKIWMERFKRRHPLCNGTA